MVLYGTVRHKMHSKVKKIFTDKLIILIAHYLCHYDFFMHRFNKHVYIRIYNNTSNNHNKRNLTQKYMQHFVMLANRDTSSTLDNYTIKYIKYIIIIVSNPIILII